MSLASALLEAFQGRSRMRFAMIVGEYGDIMGRPLNDILKAYETLAGFILYHLQEIAGIGDVVQWEEVRFEIVDMDGRRIDRLPVTTLAPPRSMPFLHPPDILTKAFPNLGSTLTTKWNHHVCRCVLGSRHHPAADSTERLLFPCRNVPGGRQESAAFRRRQAG